MDRKSFLSLLGLGFLTSCFEEDMRVNKLIPFLTGGALNSIRSLMEVWYDGTISGSDLIDKSGNARNGTATSNVLTLADTTSLETTWVQSGGTAPSVNTVVTDDLAPGETASMRFRWESVAAFFLHTTQPFILRAGDQVTLTFWAKKVTSSSITWIIRMGDGTTTGISSTLSSAVYLIGGSQAVGSWGQYQATFTNTVNGGKAQFLFNGAAGTHEIKVGKNCTVTINGETNNCFILPQVSELKTVDSLNHFYTSTGASKTIRAAWSYNAFHKKIYCGGAFKYVFLTDSPSISTHNILASNFELPSFYWSSCPIRPTVGDSGQDYTTYEAARAAASASGNYLHRTCIELYKNIVASVYADYTITIGTNKGFAGQNKSYLCATGRHAVGGRVSITGTKEDSLSDAQSGGTELMFMTNTGTGWECVDFEKTNGGYLWHHDFSGMSDGFTFISDCTMTEHGAQDIFNYRTAQGQPQPSVPLSFNVQAGGMHDGHLLKVYGTTLQGTRPYTWQDAQVSNGDGGTAYYHDCVLQSEPIYDYVDNPLSQVKENIRTTSSGIGNTVIYNTRCTRNSTINEIGIPKSIFITEI